MKEKDLKVLGFFRNNSRMSLTKLSRITKIPVSTIYDKLKEYEVSNLIKKHTSLLDFKQLGFNVRAHILLAVSRDKKKSLQDFLMKSSKVNNVVRISNGYDYLIEAIFRNLEELDEFTRTLDLFEVKEKQEFFVMEDLKSEEFLSYRENLGVLK